MSAASVPVGVSLNCQPGKQGNILVFPYALENHGRDDAYILDAYAKVDRAARATAIDSKSVVVVSGPDESVTVGKFVAPLPRDRRLAMPVVPLARRLPAGDRLECRIELPLPIAETSPYFSDLLLRQYELFDITSLVFAIGYWLAGSDGLAAMPTDIAPEYHLLVAPDIAGSMRTISQQFPVRSLQLFKRMDQFPRDIPGRLSRPPIASDRDAAPLALAAE